MRKLLVILTLLLSLCLPALAEEAMTDMTHLGKVEDRKIAALAQEINEQGVTLCDLRGVEISRAGMAQLAESCPNTEFYWQVTISTEPVDNHIAHLNLDELPRTSFKNLNYNLKCFVGLEEVTMYTYRFSIKEMEQLMADYPHIQFHYYLRLDSYLIPNDATAFSTNKGRREPRYTPTTLMKALKHTPNLVALDVGHNDVSDLSFLSNWPNLRILICVDSRHPVKDISVLKDMHDLEYVELFMQQITDISALANKTKLVDLNLCYNDITDLTPLHSCVNLERLWISCNKRLPQSEIDALQAALPNCIIETTVKSSTDAGWREHPRYFTMRESFETHYYVPLTEASGGI